jgi:TRAP-type C4-dicarboxylate transport system substrate-binding protein
MLAPMVGVVWYADAVTEATEGRVKVELYPASSLVAQAQSADAVRAGIADMYMCSFSTFRKQFPINNITGLPGVGFPDETEEANVAAEQTYLEMLQKYPAANAELKEFGPLFFYIIYSESYLIGKGSEVRVPADLKGRKVGCNGIRQEAMEMIGAVPVTDIPPLAYEKLQTGVEEATWAAISAVHDFRIFEVTDWCLDVPAGAGGMPNLINKDTWNKISPADQKIMMDLAPEASRRSSATLADLNALSWKEIDDFGMRVDATPAETAQWETSFTPLWDIWAADAKANGLDDPMGLLDWWKAKADAEWAKIK